MGFELLYLRRPKIDYISPPVCEVILSATGFPISISDALDPFIPAVVGADGSAVIIGNSGSGGPLILTWNDVPGALCYTIYKAVDPFNPNGDFEILQECLPSGSDDCPPGKTCFPLPDQGCYKISVITAEGESPLSQPICSFDCLLNTLTNGVSNVGPRSGTLNGEVTLVQGLDSKEVGVFFEWGLTESYGQTTPLQNLVVEPGGSVSFSAEISGLEGSTSYHFRAVSGSECSGTNQGGDSSFTTQFFHNSFITVEATIPDAYEIGEVPGEFTVFRTGDVSQAVTVQFSLSGTATEGTHYNAIPHEVSFAANEISKIVQITPINNFLIGPDLSVVLTITPSLLYTVSTPGDAALTIHQTEADAPCSIFVPDGAVLGEFIMNSALPPAFNNDGFWKVFSGLSIGVYGIEFVSGAYLIENPPSPTTPAFKCFFVNDQSGCSGLGAHIGYNYFDGKEESLGSEGNFTDFPLNTAPYCFSTQALAEQDFRNKAQPGGLGIKEDGGILRIKTCSADIPANDQAPSFKLVMTDKPRVDQPSSLVISDLSAFADARFAVTYNSDTTAPIALTANAATVQAALNALASITADGGVVCAGTLSGGMTVTWNVNGARSELFAQVITGSPGWVGSVQETQAGSGGTPEIQTLFVKPVCSDFVTNTGLPEYSGSIGKRDLISSANIGGSPIWFDTETPDANAVTKRQSNLEWVDTRVALIVGPDAPESAPAVSNGGAGNVTAGSHTWKITFVDLVGESTGGSASAALVLGTPSRVNLSGLPIGPEGTIARNVYRTEAGGTTYYLVGSLPNNTATIFADDLSDAEIVNQGFGVKMKPASCFWAMQVTGTFQIVPGFKLECIVWSGIKLVGLTPTGTYNLSFPWIKNETGTPVQCPVEADGGVQSLTLTG